MPYPTYDFDPRKIPSSYLEAIGFVIACASSAETILGEFIAGCLGIDVERGAALTAHMTLPLKFSTAASCAELRIHNLDKLDEIEKILADLKDALGSRNMYAHNQLGMDGNVVFCVSTQARVSLEIELVQLSVDKIKLEGLRIHEASLSIYTFMLDNGLAPAIPAGKSSRHERSSAVRKKRRKAKGRA